MATDEVVASNVSAELSKKETISERATRTRLGNIKRFGSTYYADFCIRDHLPLKEIVDKVVFDLNKPKLVAAQPLARDVVYQTLRNNYPCKK